ncbi:glycosyltransferase family 39 protein [Micromonosporaceae bacterium Da 78-11]
MLDRPPMAWRPVTLIAAAVTALLLATAGGYGYHRDELYFRMLGRHPQWGYVDQPPFTPLLTRLSIELFGDHVWAIRVPGALMIGGAAVLAAAIAREVGGRALAQSVAATGAAGTFPLVAGHITLTAGPDLLVWLGVLLFVLRALVHGQARAWLGVGVVAGLGLYNKHLVLLLLLCLAAGLLVAGPRRVLLDRRLWIGAGLALLIGLPNLIYQVANGFPQAEMAAALAADKGDEARVQMLPFQLILLGPPLVAIWVAGIVALLRDPRLRPARALALAYPVMIVLLLVVAGQPYYSLGLVLGLFAVGAVPAARWSAGHRARQALLGAAIAVNVVVSVVFALPVTPRDRLGSTFVAGINQGTADQIGWRQYVRQVADVYATLTPDEQRRTVLFTGNYGEAGALDRYGVPLGLPKVYSGQNELHHYGPPPESKTVVVVVSEAPAERVDAVFGGCEWRTRLHNDEGVDNEETEASVYVCRTRRTPWRELWPSLQHYD